MDSIALSVYRNSATALLKSAGQAAGIGLLAFLGLRWGLDAPVVDQAGKGLLWAWGMSTLSTAALLRARESSPKAFWRVFWSSMAARWLVLAVLMAMSLQLPSRQAAALLVSYAAGILAMLLVEYRQVPLR